LPKAEKINFSMLVLARTGMPDACVGGFRVKTWNARGFEGFLGHAGIPSFSTAQVNHA